MKFYLTIVFVLYLSGCASPVTRAIASDDNPIIFISRYVDIPLPQASSRYVDISLPQASSRIEDLIIEIAEASYDLEGNDPELLSQLPFRWYRIDPTKCKLSSEGNLLQIPRSEFPNKKNSVVRVRLSR